MADNRLLLFAIQADLHNFRTRLLSGFTKLGTSLAVITMAMNYLSTWGGFSQELNLEPQRYHVQREFWKEYCNEYFEFLRGMTFRNKFEKEGKAVPCLLDVLNDAKKLSLGKKWPLNDTLLLNFTLSYAVCVTGEDNVNVSCKAPFNVEACLEKGFDTRSEGVTFFSEAMSVTLPLVCYYNVESLSYFKVFLYQAYTFTFFISATLLPSLNYWFHENLWDPVQKYLEGFCNQGKPLPFVIAQFSFITACDDVFFNTQFIPYVFAYAFLAFLYLIIKESRNFQDYVKLLEWCIVTSGMFVFECLIYQFREKIKIYVNVHFIIIQARYLVFLGINIFMVPFLIVASIIELFLFMFRELLDKIFPRIVFMNAAEQKKCKTPELGFNRDFFHFSTKLIRKKLGFLSQ